MPTSYKVFQNPQQNGLLPKLLLMRSKQGIIKKKVADQSFMDKNENIGKLNLEMSLNFLKRKSKGIAVFIPTMQILLSLWEKESVEFIMLTE